MGAPESPVLCWSLPPTSPPSKTPAALPLLPPPPPPPPPLPPGFFPLCFLPSSPPAPLPLPPPPCGLPMPIPGAGAAASSAAPPRALLPTIPVHSGGSRSAEGGHSVEHLARALPGGVVLVTAPAQEDEDLAGVPPDLLPLKKRVVRYHPYEAAAAIQEMASRAYQNWGSFATAAAAAPARPRPGPNLEEEDGLRAELLRLRIRRAALVLTKQLTFSDRSRDMARLVLPFGLVASSPLLGMLTPPERRLVFGAGLPVRALDRLGRAYRMTLRQDPRARTYRLTGQWSLFVSRHHMSAGDAVEVRAFRPCAWQKRLDKHGEGGLGMALLLRQGNHWCSLERDAADGLLLIAVGARRPTATAAGA